MGFERFNRVGETELRFIPSPPPPPPSTHAHPRARPPRCLAIFPAVNQDGVLDLTGWGALKANVDVKAVLTKRFIPSRWWWRWWRWWCGGGVCVCGGGESVSTRPGHQGIHGRVAPKSMHGYPTYEAPLVPVISAPLEIAVLGDTPVVKQPHRETDVAGVGRWGLRCRSTRSDSGQKQGGARRRSILGQPHPRQTLYRTVHTKN